MAAFDTTRTTYGTATVAGQFFATVSHFAASIVSWNDARVTRNMLNTLTDRELEDIGLCRGDIQAVAEAK